MLRAFHHGLRLCDDVSRREWLRVGAIGLGGLTLPQLLRSQAKGTGNLAPRAKVILLFNTGGMPQHETWDPKPEAPANVRGEFAAIAWSSGRCLP